MTSRERILAAAEDSGAEFVFYHRKEDEDLPVAAIEGAILEGEITYEEIAEAFLRAVRAQVETTRRDRER